MYVSCHRFALLLASACVVHFVTLMTCNVFAAGSSAVGDAPAPSEERGECSRIVRRRTWMPTTVALLHMHMGVCVYVCTYTHIHTSCMLTRTHILVHAHTHTHTHSMCVCVCVADLCMSVCSLYSHMHTHIRTHANI